MRKLNGKSKLLLLALVIVALICALMINSNPVSAERNEVVVNPPFAIENVDSEQSLSASIFPSIVKLVSALALVIIAIYVGLYLLKKMMGKKYSANQAGSVLEVLETTHLSPKKSVSLIRVADKAVLVGSTENQIAVLSELDEASTAKIVSELDQPVETVSFSSMLKIAGDKMKTFTAVRGVKPTAETQV